MGFFDDLKSGLEKKYGQYKNRSFMEACMAACALVTMADGNASSEEKQKVLGYCRINEMLKVFDFNDITKVFNGHLEKYSFDQGVGESETMAALSKHADGMDIEQKKCILAVCCVVGKADGNFDPTEKEMVRKIRTTLKLADTDFAI